MKIGPKYKIARRLGAAVFEKTQTAKFALSAQKKQPKKMKALSSFGKQLLEKQKVRSTYTITEKQMRKYAKEAAVQNPSNTAAALFEKLERRLETVVLRAGFAVTRLGARQMVSHGHIMVNGKKTTIPSYQVTDKDKITIRPGSMGSGLFVNLDERLSEQNFKPWISVDKVKKEISLKGVPVYSQVEEAFSLQLVVQYYKR